MLKYTVNEYFPNTGKNEKEKKSCFEEFPVLEFPSVLH